VNALVLIASVAPAMANVARLTKRPPPLVDSELPDFNSGAQPAGKTQTAPLAAVSDAPLRLGTGTAANPQHLEAMSEDLGPYEAGFVANFAYRNLTLANKTYVQLVNNANNTDSDKPEAVYVDTLVVPAGTTLDLNHLHLYARTSQIGGTILKGRVEPILPQPSATVGLDNQSPETNDVLTATATKSGPEGRTVSLTFVWQVNGIERRTYTSDTALTDTFDLSVPGHGDRGDTITVTVTPRDGTVVGASVSEAVTVVGDHDPLVEIEAALRLVRDLEEPDHISDAAFVDYASLASAPDLAAGSRHAAGDRGRNLRLGLHNRPCGRDRDRSWRRVPRTDLRNDRRCQWPGGQLGRRHVRRGRGDDAMGPSGNRDHPGGFRR